MIQKVVLTTIGEYQDEIISKESQLIVLDGVTQIGRKAKTENVTVFFNIKDSSVSRQHAEIYPSGDDSWKIKDLGSTNGTYINGEKIYSEPIKLNKGDIIGIGNDISFQFERTLLNPNYALLCYPSLKPDGSRNEEGLEVIDHFKNEIAPYGFAGNIGELIDETRNRVNLLSWFDMLKRFSTHESISLIYIVGHGVDNEHLGLHREGIDTVPWGLTITYTELFYWLSFVRGNKLLVLDECIPMNENEKITSRTTVIMNPFSRNRATSLKAMGPFLQNLSQTLIHNHFFQITPESRERIQHDLGENIIIQYQKEGYFNTPVIAFKMHGKEFEVSEFSRTVKLMRNSY
jgi:hypothetical protein